MLTRGEPRSIRTTQSRCRFLRVTSVCPTSNLARSVVVLGAPCGVSRCPPFREGDHDGARVPGPREGRVLDREAGGAARIECVRLGSRTLTTFPSSASRRHPAVAGATARRGGDPYRTRRTSRGLLSDVIPRRSTSSWRPGCLPPSRARAAAGFLLGIPRRPPVRAAHTFSTGCGEVPLVGHCEPRNVGCSGL
jgi:hypothetical protein